MPVIALSRLVVIAKHAFASDNVCQGIFIRMTRAPNTSRNMPDSKLDKSFVIDQVALAQKQFGLHVGEYTNIVLMSTSPTIAGTSASHRAREEDFLTQTDLAPSKTSLAYARPNERIRRPLYPDRSGS